MDWVIDFWNLGLDWVFVALPFGFSMILLFYSDHIHAWLIYAETEVHPSLQNISSQIRRASLVQDDPYGVEEIRLVELNNSVPL